MFFILGLAIALQSRRYSRLDLARNLYWLAGFGILHGLQEWGDLIIPKQAYAFSRPVVPMLGAGQLLLLAVSFVCLFEFGVSLLVSLGWSGRLHLIAPALLLSWILGSYYIVLPLSTDLLSWYATCSALARYFICFPGGLLAAFGLWREVRERISAFNTPVISRTFGVAAAALALYALFGGLIPHQVVFFPGNLFNSTVFEDWVGAPPLVVRSLIGLVLSVSIIRGLDIFEIEVSRMVRDMEEQQIRSTERERWARDLHDGTIQTVYTAGLLVESARKLLPEGTQAVERLVRAEGLLNEAIGSLRQSLVELREPAGSLSLCQILRDLTEDPRYHSLVKINFSGAEAVDLAGKDSFRADEISHIRSIVLEALSNVVRHARAHTVSVTVQYLQEGLLLQIRDDGQGIRGQPSHGYGLRNMRERAHLVGGHLDIDSRPGRGTTIRLYVPREKASGQEHKHEQNQSFAGG